MTLQALLNHLIFGTTLFFISFSISWWMATKKPVMDIPNHRSSHKNPVPTSGGIAIVLTFVIGVFAIYLIGDKTMIKSNYFIGFVLSGLLISGISLYDDYKQKPLLMRLMSQMIGVLTVMAFGLVIKEISLPIVGKLNVGYVAYFLTFIWLIGLTNAYNFMDGINGLAGGTAVLTAISFCIISILQGSNFVYIICYPIIAGSMGFLCFNFPKAKIFMGDVGSAFLGFTFGTLAIIGSLYDASHTSFFVIPLLLFHFIYDTSFTFICRFLNGENVFTAHRRHLYQLFVQLGYTHFTVSCFHYGMCIFQGVGAYFLVQIPGSKRLIVFIPFLLFQIAYSQVIIWKAKQANLI